VAASLRGVLANMERQTLGVDGQQLVARYSTNLVRVNPAGEIQVYVELIEFRPEHVARLESEGLRVQVSLPEARLVQGWLRASAVDAVGALHFVKAVRPPDYPVRNSVGGASTAGDAIHRADAARAIFRVSGAGVKVGVISDGVDFLVDSQQSGDLPFVEVLFAGDGNEGTAMLEIVHDVAPGAALAFWGPGTSAEMVQGINALRDAGARIVVDDLSFFGEPKFQDGIIAQAGRAFAQNGRAYATSAGNRGQEHYRSGYIPLFGQAYPTSDYPSVHNYNPGDPDLGNTVTIPNGCSLTVHLQWSNPWGAANDDLDLFIGRSDDLAVLSSSENPQSGSENPFESAFWHNDTGGSVDVFIAVAEWARRTTLPLVIDYFALPNCGNALQYLITAQGVAGNHAVNEVFSVAAVGAANPDLVEDYSSRGPHEIFFPAFESRPVPNISAVACVQTYTGQLGYFSNPFCGTSAAAPHVAGVLALLAQASPALDSQQIRNLVMGTSIDLGPPGFEFTYGAGRVDAVNAIYSSPLPPFAFLTSNGTSFRGGETIALALTLANPPGNPPLDLYVGALFPDGNTIAWLSGSNTVGGIGALSAPASVAKRDTLFPGSAANGVPVLALSLPGTSIPGGTYYLFASLFRQGSLADNRSDNGDLVWLSFFPVTYLP
jgi:subtilisin family serine protease